MYVDDDAVVGLTVSTLLERQGYRVTFHARAKDALAEFEADPQAFAVVVTDFNMPDLSGLEVAAVMLHVRPGLPMVITSGHVSEDLRRRAGDVGVRHVMFKEFTLEQLGGIVAELLAESDDHAA
jgi:CheY-like chemotaxis protein